jgi:hypothetical protein
VAGQTIAASRTEVSASITLEVMGQSLRPDAKTLLSLPWGLPVAPPSTPVDGAVNPR